jgi:hypothetical protein
MLKRFALVALVAAMLPAAARAATIDTAGPRFGFSIDPSQFVFGGQFSIHEVAPSISFDPNLDLGFGDHETVIALGLDLHYHFHIEDTDWSPYAGAGVGIHFVDVNEPAPYDNTSTQVGGNLIIGASVPTRSNNQFFGEMKFGLGDAPTLKLLAGWNFKI